MTALFWFALHIIELEKLSKDSNFNDQVKFQMFLCILKKKNNLNKKVY